MIFANQFDPQPYNISKCEIILPCKSVVVCRGISFTKTENGSQMTFRCVFTVKLNVFIYPQIQQRQLEDTRISLAFISLWRKMFAGGMKFTRAVSFLNVSRFN